MPIKLKCHEHSEEAIKTDKQSHLTKFTSEKPFAVTFLVINCRKLKWHQDGAHEEDRTRYSASATSECRRNIKDHSNRLKGVCEVTGHKLLQKRICSLPGHTMRSVLKWENLLQYLYLCKCFLQCHLPALTANKGHFALDFRLLLVNLLCKSVNCCYAYESLPHDNKSVTRTL